MNAAPSLRVSVIVPVYNGAAYLADAIASIRAQQYAPLEIIIVDDGSTDETAAIAASLGADVRYVYQQNQGPAAARNRGLKAATGEVIAFLDADDLWTPDKLELQLGILARHPGAAVVMGHMRAFREDPAIPVPSPYNGETALLANQVGSTLVRRTVFERIGGFDEGLRYGEDIDWLMRVREAGISIHVLAEVTLLYRIHANNMTRGGDTSYVLTRVLHRSLERRRQDSSRAVIELLPLQRELDE